MFCGIDYSIMIAMCVKMDCGVRMCTNLETIMNVNVNESTPLYAKKNSHGDNYCIICTHRVNHGNRKHTKGRLLTSTLYNYFKTATNVVQRNGSNRYLNAVHNRCLDLYVYLPVK